MSDENTLAALRRRWSRDGGMGNTRGAEDYTDKGCRLIAESAFRDFPALLAEVQRLTAELALKDQALDEIKALHTAIVYDEAGNAFCAHSRLDEPCETARVLTRLDGPQ